MGFFWVRPVLDVIYMDHAVRPLLICRIFFRRKQVLYKILEFAQRVDAAVLFPFLHGCIVDPAGLNYYQRILPYINIADFIVKLPNPCHFFQSILGICNLYCIFVIPFLLDGLIEIAAIIFYNVCLLYVFLLLVCFAIVLSRFLCVSSIRIFRRLHRNCAIFGIRPYAGRLCPTGILCPFLHVHFPFFLFFPDSRKRLVQFLICAAFCHFCTPRLFTAGRPFCHLDRRILPSPCLLCFSQFPVPVYGTSCCK